jgi:hypothetical protein
MKKILNWVLPAFLGIVPALGAEDLGIINDSFFTKDGVARSISRVVENGPKIMAQVTGTDSNETRNKLVEALCATVGWQNNDDQLNAQEIINAQIICGPDFLEKHHVRALRVPYTLEKETEGKFLQGILMKENDALPVGETVAVCKLIEYKRPDGTIFIKSGETLYELLLEETRVTGPEFRHCQYEWDIISQFKKKTRHRVQTYTRQDVTQTTYRIPTIGDRIELSRTTVVELKPGPYEAEVPTCGQKSWPANHKIVS